MENLWNSVFANLSFLKENFGENSFRNFVWISLDKSLKPFAFEVQVASSCFVEFSGSLTILTNLRLSLLNLFLEDVFLFQISFRFFWFRRIPSDARFRMQC